MNKRKRDQVVQPTPTEHDKSLLKKYEEGPLNLLLSSTQNQSPILIQLRNNRKLIGTCRAFDYHMNVVLENVVEMWSETVSSGQSKRRVNKSRKISKMFLRGDSIVLIVRDPAEKENERKRREEEKEREERAEGLQLKQADDTKDQAKPDAA